MLRSLMMVCVLSLTCVGAQASLLGRLAFTPGGTDYQAYYDTDTNLTWVADANLAKTSGYDADGQMQWVAAQGWITSLNAQNSGLGYLGTNNWRLPTVTDTGASDCDFAYTGTDCGFNMDLSTGEMARMYYSTLGNTAGYNASGVEQPCHFNGFPNYCLTNTGPFSNLQRDGYWSGTEYTTSIGGVWVLLFHSGEQVGYNKNNVFDAWALRTGDIAAVPIPPAVWLFSSALGLMGLTRRNAKV